MIVTEATSGHGSTVSLLILGAGWTSTFLIPLLQREGVKYAATTTNGRNGTIPFKFDPASDDNTPFTLLPSARTVLVTFPLEGKGQAERLVSAYAATHPEQQKEQEQQPNYILFGVTSIWTSSTWQDDSSPYDTSHPRAIAEDELLSCTPRATILSLAGLYGGDRQPRNWVGRVIRSKDELRAKGALHVIHGNDVARAVLAVHGKFTPGKRWILCDMHVYDWWDLVQDWATQALSEKEEDGEGEVGVSEAVMVKQTEMLSWVGQLMMEEGVRALPRDSEAVGRRLDGRGFWNFMGIWPKQGRIR